MNPDDRLVRRAQAGDRDAFAELVREHRHRLMTLAARELGSAADAEDAVQETLVRAWRALPRFRAESAFSTWLYRICVNAVHDQRARSARGGGIPLDDVVEPASTHDAIATGELSGELQRALAELDETYRTAVLMYDVLGRSYAEVAEVLGVPDGTVKSRISRGRVELARRLGTTSAAGESKQ